MRLLNQNEQDLCQRILNGHGRVNYIGSIIYNKLEGVCINILKKERTVEIIINYESSGDFPTTIEFEEIKKRIDEISLVILESVNLIKNFEKEGYIQLLQKANVEKNDFHMGACIQGKNFVPLKFGDVNISDLLIEYVNKEIYITEEFRNFCKHGFIARDEQRFRKEIFYTRFALLVSVIIGLAGIFFNSFSYISREHLDYTKIYKEQIDSLSTGFNQIAIKLDTLNNLTKQIVSTKPLVKTSTKKRK